MTNSPNSATETPKTASPAVAPASTPQQNQGYQKSSTDKPATPQQK